MVVNSKTLRKWGSRRPLRERQEDAAGFPPKGLVHSFAKFFIYVARAAICSSDDWPDVSVAWVAKDREYFLVEAAAVEAPPRTRAETAEFRLLPG